MLNASFCRCDNGRDVSESEGVMREENSLNNDSPNNKGVTWAIYCRMCLFT